MRGSNGAGLIPREDKTVGEIGGVCREKVNQEPPSQAPLEMDSFIYIKEQTRVACSRILMKSSRVPLPTGTTLIAAFSF